MPKPLARRVCIGVLLTAAIAVAGFGVYHTAYWFWARRTVALALSDDPRWPRYDIQRNRVKKMGEGAVPLVFGEMRDHIGPEGPVDFAMFWGQQVLGEMALERKLDPEVPYLSAVLRNTRENEDLRGSAATILGCAWYSDTARGVLAEAGLHDRSAGIRSSCLNQLGHQTDHRAARTKDWRIDPLVIDTLRAGVKDPDPYVRSTVCMVAGRMASLARQRGSTLKWAESLVVQCSKDSHPRVRSEAARMMEQIETSIAGKP